jgi:hypothetical protein
MTTPYTDDERQLLASLPHTIGSAMAFAESSGVFGTGKEMFASAQSMMSGLKDFPNNALIQSIVPKLAATDDRQAQMQRLQGTRDWAMARMKSKGIDHPSKFRELALSDARDAAALLAAKGASQEADEYRRWVMSVAEGVASAASEGGFLGFGSTRISEGEKKLLADLRAALGTA